MNMLLNARWGHVGDNGALPLPFDGLSILELTVKKEDGKLKFIFFTYSDDMGDLSIRDRSAFDGILYGTNLSFGKQNYWFKYDEMTNGWPREDPMFSAINLGLHMLKKVEELYCSFGSRHYAIELDGAHTFVKDWINKNLDECDIPLFISGVKTDDDWDEKEIPF